MKHISLIIEVSYGPYVTQVKWVVHERPPFHVNASRRARHLSYVMAMTMCLTLKTSRSCSDQLPYHIGQSNNDHNIFENVRNRMDLCHTSTFLWSPCRGKTLLCFGLPKSDRPCPIHNFQQSYHTHHYHTLWVLILVYASLV